MLPLPVCSQQVSQLSTAFLPWLACGSLQQGCLWSCLPRHSHLCEFLSLAVTMLQGQAQMPWNPGPIIVLYKKLPSGDDTDSFFNLFHNVPTPGFPYRLKLLEQGTNLFSNYSISVFSLTAFLPQGSDAKVCWDGRERKKLSGDKKEEIHISKYFWPYILYIYMRSYQWQYIWSWLIAWVVFFWPPQYSPHFTTCEVRRPDHLWLFFLEPWPALRKALKLSREVKMVTSLPVAKSFPSQWLPNIAFFGHLWRHQILLNTVHQTGWNFKTVFHQMERFWSKLLKRVVNINHHITKVWGRGRGRNLYTLSLQPPNATLLIWILTVISPAGWGTECTHASGNALTLAVALLSTNPEKVRHGTAKFWWKQVEVEKGKRHSLPWELESEMEYERVSETSTQVFYFVQERQSQLWKGECMSVSSFFFVSSLLRAFLILHSTQ